MKKSSNFNIIQLLRSSFAASITNPLILQPYIIILFIQLLVLELLYFSPRYPLLSFFGPWIKYHWSTVALHYPFHLGILPILYQNPNLQGFIYIVFSSYLICTSMIIIAAINNEQKISLGMALKQAFSRYVHIFFAACIIYGLIRGLDTAYTLVIKRAYMIRSETGMFFILKQVIVYSSSYVKLLISIFVTGVFGFLFQSIVIDRKKIHTAIIHNFKKIYGNFWLVFMTICLPSLLYVPFLVFEGVSGKLLGNMISPELNLIILIISIFVVAFIDLIIYTSLTSLYLIKKES